MASASHLAVLVGSGSVRGCCHGTFDPGGFGGLRLGSRPGGFGGLRLGSRRAKPAFFRADLARTRSKEASLLRHRSR